jgi:hypothetical protein
METARILVRYVKNILLLTPNSLKMSKWGTANSPVHITSIFSFSPDICKHGGYNCNRGIFYRFCKFRQSCGQLWKVNSILRSSCSPTPRKRNEAVRGQRTRWRIDSAACAHLFAWELSVQVPPDVERSNMLSRSYSSKSNRREELRRHV